MGLTKTKTICTVTFQNTVNGVDYRYDVQHEENSSPSRISFTVEKDALTVVRGYQDHVNGTFSFEVIRQLAGFDRPAVQLVVDKDLAEISQLIK